MVTAMAPRLSDIDVMYEPLGSLVDRLDATLNRSLIKGPMPKVVSYSGGFCEPVGTAYSKVALEYVLTEHILMDMAATGISFVAAAGDTGSSCNQANAAIAGARLLVSFPASSPYATERRWELLGLDATDEIQGQEVWDDLPLGSGLAGGGGQSAVFARPWYQQHLTTAEHGRLCRRRPRGRPRLPHRQLLHDRLRWLWLGRWRWDERGHASDGGRDRPGR